MRLKHFIFVSILLGGLIAIGGYVYVVSALKAEGPLKTEQTIYIEQGSSVGKIAHTLKNEKIIRDILIFKIGARINQTKGTLKAGEYMIPAHASIHQVIDILQSGKTFQRQITFAEGLTVYDIMHALNAAEGLTDTITPDDLPADGTLLPETYNYSFGDSRKDILKRMAQSMTDTLDALWDTRMDGLPIKTRDEAVTLASIVEKETGVKAERAKVAGVFINRLNINMALQSDPTVIYAVTLGKEKLDRPIYRKDLNIDSPYNTYKVTGLPPTPLANPGRASLEAVMNPEKHDFFYFVADGTGGHAFSKTLDEHLRNVSQWRVIEQKRKKK